MNGKTSKEFGLPEPEGGWFQPRHTNKQVINTSSPKPKQKYNCMFTKGILSLTHFGICILLVRCNAFLQMAFPKPHPARTAFSKHHGRCNKAFKLHSANMPIFRISIAKSHNSILSLSLRPSQSSESHSCPNPNFKSRPVAFLWGSNSSMM